MALTQTNNGDTGLVARTNTNAGFTQIDTNVVDIATNVADITALELNSLIQKKTFIYTGNTDIVNSSSTVYVATNLLVAITPRSATSELLIHANQSLLIGSSQKGAKFRIEYKVGAGAWTYLDVSGISASQWVNIDPAITSFITPVDIRAIMDSPGVSDEIQFRTTFVAVTNTFDATITAAHSTQMITVEELI